MLDVCQGLPTGWSCSQSFEMHWGAISTQLYNFQLEEQRLYSQLMSLWHC